MTSYAQSTLLTFNMAAGADLSAKQYFAVKLASTAGEVVLAGNGQGIGILQNDPADGATAIVGYLGESKAVAEASVTAGSRITANSTGQVQATTTANNSVLGINLEASTNAGDIVRVLLTGSNY